MATKLKQASIAIRQNKGRDYSPRWDGADEWDADKFTRHFHAAMAWYRLESSVKDLKPKLVEWCKLNGFDQDDTYVIRKTKDKYFNGTMVAIAACLLKGMPEVHDGFNQGRDSAAWLRKEIEKVLKEGANDLEEDDDAPKPKKVEVYVPSIQDRLREAAGDMSEELDYAIDKWITDPEAFNPKEFKIVNLLKGKGAKAAHSRIIKGYFQRSLDELHELAGGGADEQLKEAYKHVSRKNVKKLIEFYEGIAQACEQIAAEQKVLKKPRAKKVKPAEDLVKKMKFMLSDTKLGITSVPPASIIGSQGAVVYNTKTRKIGVYIAKNGTLGLQVKGTSIIEFSDKSVQKTLRKPLEQLKEFKEQNTQRRAEQWFAGIKTTSVALNGRMSEDIVILKVFK